MKKRLKSVKSRPKNDRHKAYRSGCHASQLTNEVIDADVESEESELITTVNFKQPLPEEKEAGMTHKQKRMQSLKKLSVRLHQAIENNEIDGLPGYTARRLRIDAKNRVTLKSLPVYYKSALTSCQQLIHSPAILPSLMACECMSRKPSRTIMSRVLAVLLTSTEFEGGRIGLLVKKVGVDPITHHKLMEEYLMRFGCLIDKKTWYDAVMRLRLTGYLYSAHVKAAIEVKNQAQEIQRIVRSAASYKQFTAKFFEEFKVTFYPNVSQWIREANQRYKQQGYLFKWKDYTILAGEIRDRLEAQFLNELITSTGSISAEPSPEPTYY